MDFETICRRIKDLEIQGAVNVAKAGVEALQLKHDAASVKKLLSLRPTEPCLQNAVKFALVNIQKNSTLAMSHFDEAQRKINVYGSQKIKNNSAVFTHCHSSAVTSIFKRAKEDGKHFEVYNTETRPKFQGRITATELANVGIKVTHFVDSAMMIAIKKADGVFIGADAITFDGRVANKIGSALVAEIAKKYKVPFYVCTDAWKFDVSSIYGKEVRIEERNPGEVWENPPKNVMVSNFAFEFVQPEYITAIISELGVLKPRKFVKEVIQAYPYVTSSLR